MEFLVIIVAGVAVGLLIARRNGAFMQRRFGDLRPSARPPEEPSWGRDSGANAGGGGGSTGG